MPVGDGDLAGDECGFSGVAIFEDFQQVVSGLGVEGFEPPVVEDQQVGAGQALEAAGEAAVAVGQGEFVEQLCHPYVEHRTVVAAGFVAERAGQPALAHAGGPGDDEVVMVLDPGALDEPLQECARSRLRPAR